MYWNETDSKQDETVSADVVDLVFGIRCRSLPVDHAWLLSEALVGELPWLIDERQAGIHPIYISESGNGWMRPENPDDILHLSKRTRLILRVPKHRQQEAEQLVGKMLSVAGSSMEIVSVSKRMLSSITTLFSRYVVSDETDEAVFLDRIIQELHAMNIRPGKILPGKERILRTSDRHIETRSLMLTDITVAEAVRLQQDGLGPYRHLGCGMFVPHKDILEVGSE